MMDQRKAELKRLKKAYQKTKRRYVGVWKALAVIFLIVALIAAFILFVPLLPVMILVLILSEAAVTFLAENIWLFYAVFGGSTVLFILFALLAFAGKKKLKKTGAYLDYRTMKLTLQAEKEAMQ